MTWLTWISCISIGIVIITIVSFQKRKRKCKCSQTECIDDLIHYKKRVEREREQGIEGETKPRNSIIIRIANYLLLLSTEQHQARKNSITKIYIVDCCCSKWKFASRDVMRIFRRHIHIYMYFVFLLIIEIEHAIISTSRRLLEKGEKKKKKKLFST